MNIIDILFQEIIYEILVECDYKSILRINCSCKYFNEIIDENFWRNYII